MKIYKSNITKESLFTIKIDRKKKNKKAFYQEGKIKNKKNCKKHKNQTNNKKMKKGLFLHKKNCKPI